MKPDKYDVVLACGGLGTRLQEITKDIPKPLFLVNGKSTLERCIEQLENYQFKRVILTIGYKSKNFLEFVEYLNKKYQIYIEVFLEKKPMGECGALWNLKEKLCDDFIFINGDLIFSIDFKKLKYFHKRLSSNLTLVTHTSDHPEDSDLVSVPNGSLVEAIFSKEKNKEIDKDAYLGNSGIFILNKVLLEKISAPKENDSKSIFHFIVKNAFNLNINIYSYNTTEYIKDMGTPKRLKVVENDLLRDKVNKKNYTNSQKTLFLDRDNTLIKCDIGKYILKEKDIDFDIHNIEKILPISFNYDFVCLLTNQPSISMGRLNLKDLDRINTFVVKFCLSKGLKIDVVTFCPHHPHKGYQGEISILKKDCFCRKPNPGLFLEQAFFRNIDLKKSLMIGDSDNDYLAAMNAGCNFLNVNDL
ncbi:HAD-IIIA family hydrolase [Prochlorococcus marinus]|uniref:HAD-IIIA family hydrolase n=1 Tax=Prochlorococcus marinus TaxID=1219 RepID=UPI001AD98E75|nr:HAD-IIIA family hydrolase [Prochlorococcus marinus]MBO8221396.1 HAD-IIIA family hydrolase [Prochlorococcus marinus CUG1417]MBW3074206.1 hypothetical protein [Prochlorococcus marinus str. MU1417]